MQGWLCDKVEVWSSQSAGGLSIFMQSVYIPHRIWCEDKCVNHAGAVVCRCVSDVARTDRDGARSALPNAWRSTAFRSASPSSPPARWSRARGQLGCEQVESKITTLKQVTIAGMTDDESISTLGIPMRLKPS